MKRKLIAGFCSFLIVFATFHFALLFNVEEVEALPSVEGAAFSTCVRTENDDFCVESETGKYNGADCLSGFEELGMRVADVERCKQGVCVPGDGSQCLVGKSKWECIVLYSEGAWKDATSTEAVPECQKGCCNVANSICQVEQKTVCINELGGREEDFTPGLVNINDCDATCRPDDIGCCNLGGGECSFGRQAECSGTFNLGTQCNAVIGCNVETKSYIAKGDGTTDDDELDCYWYDSKGNREDVAFDCDYPDEFCYDSDGDRGVDAYCRSTACVEDCADCDPAEFNTGDSLCLDVSPAHYANSERSTAIKPYKLSCQWGSIVPDDQQKDRSSVCIEDVTFNEDLERDEIHAKWIENNWEACVRDHDDGGDCGQGGPFDIFAYLPLPFMPLLLLADGLNNQCRGDDNFDKVFVWDGEVCRDAGKDPLTGTEMCGAPHVFAGDEDDFDNDFWAPIGSCGPRYPPSISTDGQCNLCGSGADGSVNLCTEQECNALGDCQFEEDGILSSGTYAAGALYTSSCLTYATLAYYTPIPGAREGLLSTAAAFCLGIGSGLKLGAVLMAIGLGYSVGANAAARVVDPSLAQFELTEDGQVKVEDVLMFKRVIESETGENVDNAMASELANTIYLAGGQITDTGLSSYLVNLGTYNVLKDSFSYLVSSDDIMVNIAKSSSSSQVVTLTAELESYWTPIIAESCGGTCYVDEINTLVDEKVAEELQIFAEEKSASIAAVTSKIAIVLHVIATLIQIFSLGESFQTGKCVPEKPLTTNEKCGQCGPGDGQWWCTAERCGILGAWSQNEEQNVASAGNEVGACRWIAKEGEIGEGEQYDGICWPLDPSEIVPPKITGIDMTFYDTVNTILSTASSENYRLDTSAPWNTIKGNLKISTDEPALCKYSKLAGKTFESGEMSGFNIADYVEEHEVDIEFSASDKVNPDFKIYLRCEDINGNKIENDNNFVKINFGEAPDETAPVIEAVTPQGGMFPEETITAEVTVVAYDKNKVAECKYSQVKIEEVGEDLEFETNYGDMTGIFTKGETDVLCPASLVNECDVFRTTLDIPALGEALDIGDSKEAVTYFANIRCKDSLGNEMQESHKATLAIMPNFNITIVSPIEGEEIWTPYPSINVETSVPTSCTYTVGGVEYNLTEGPDSTIHTKEHPDPLSGSLTGVSHTLNVHCVDYNSNNENDASVTFLVKKDETGPEVEKIYSDGGFLSVLLNEVSTCEFSNSNPVFTFGGGEGVPMVSSDEGKLHKASLSEKDDEVFYIQCQDEFSNGFSFGTLTVYP